MNKRLKKGKAQGSQSLESELASAFEWVARAAIDAGVDAGGFLRAARIGLARAGNHAVQLGGSRSAASASRIAALTGLTRKEIPELLADGSRVTAPRASPLWALVKAWSESSDFLDSSGKPKSLPIDGQVESLRSLVAKVTADIPHISVLKELEANGLVSTQSSGKIRLSRNAIGHIGRKEKDLQKLSRRLRRMSQSAYAAISETQEGMIAEEAVLEGVPRNLVGLFLKDFSERAEALLGAVSKWESAHVKEPKTADPGERVGLGVYLIRERSSQPLESNSPIGSGRPTRRAKRA